MGQRRMYESCLRVAIIVVLLSWAGADGVVGAQEVAYVQVGDDPNGDRVVAIDTASNQVVDVFEFPQGAFGVAVSPDGSRLYVSNAFANQITALEPLTGLVVGVVPTAAPVPMLAISSDGQLLYAGVRDNTVLVIDTSSLAVLATIAVGDEPEFVELSDDGTRLVALNFGDGDVSVIETATNTVLATLPAGQLPFAAAFEPNSLVVWVTPLFDAAGQGSVHLLDTGPGVVLGSTLVGPTAALVGIDILPDGSRAYVADAQHNEIAVIDVASRAVLGSVAVGVVPAVVQASLDGSRVFVSNVISGDVSVIDTTTDSVSATIPVGGRPVDVAFGPSPQPSGAVEAVAGAVEALLFQGAISAGQAGALSAKLDSAADRLASGNVGAASNKLEAFTNQVEAMLRSARISEEDGRKLIDAARVILDYLD